MDAIDDFFVIADAFLAFIRGNEINTDTSETLMLYLMKLYMCALSLPDAEPESEDIRSDGNSPIPLRITCPNLYWEIFDPFADDAPVCGSLSDDLSDIANNLLYGMKAYQEGRKSDAAFDWQFGMNAHWGQHAVDAVKALHCLRTRSLPICSNE